MNNIDLFTVMERDLKTRQYPGEDKELYYARLLYSGMSTWLKTSTLDKDILDNSKLLGSSKAHVLKRCERVLQEVLELYPVLKKWYYPDSSDINPVEVIRERMLRSGELIEIGFQTNITVPVYREFRLSKDVSLTRGLKPSFKMGFSSGLAWLIMNPEFSASYVPEDVFQLCPVDAACYTEMFIKEVNWEKAVHIESDEIFDSSIRKSLSSCWRNDYVLKEGEVTLARKYIGHNVYEFYLIKKLNSVEFIHRLDEYLKGKTEIRRLLYGLRILANNPINASIKSHKDEGLIELTLYSKLPQNEENILLLLGWPKNNIGDTNNLIFVDEVWDYISKILQNLNIKL